ncbi:MAG: hypothetical protein KAS07_04770 [Candidatus Pacebacteria bacterium]|nr:hypothetical protein [Candidatus Paceibacterota bacterium]
MNRNKINGVLAEIDFRKYISDLGFANRVSGGGWIVRSDSRGQYDFAQNTAVLFPETIQFGEDYPNTRRLPEPQRGLHTICATFHQIGIKSFFCAATIEEGQDGKKIKWKSTELGLPETQPYLDFPESIQGFNKRQRRYNFERYKTDSSIIPVEAVPEEFSKESLRVAFNACYFTEPSDVDGLFWGKEKTYPIEIKEKTRASDNKIGGYFGLDIGPFVKLAFYAAKRGNLHSMFVVREIDDEQTRNLVSWKYITFEELAQYASWVFQPGGRGMTGGRSATVKIPANRFMDLVLCKN